MEREVAVTENWREALRLCVASCSDDNVDDVLLAILNPLEGEDTGITARPRAVLAALCLADEPNVNEAVVWTVLQVFIRQVGENDGKGPIIQTGVDVATIELASSHWAEMLRSLLFEEFCRRDAATRWSFGSLCAMVVTVSVPQDQAVFHDWLIRQVARSVSGEEAAIDAALSIMYLASRKKIRIIPGIADGLLAMLTGSAAASHAAAWALFWLNNERLVDNAWRPSTAELERIITVVNNPATDTEAVRWLIRVLSRERDQRAIEVLISKLDHQNSALQQAAAKALGQIRDMRVVIPLIAKLDHQDSTVRQLAIQVLGQIRDMRAVEPLIAKLEDQDRTVRQATIEALGRIGEQLKDAVLYVRMIEALITRLKDQDKVVQQVTARVLGQIKDMRAVESLIDVLSADDRGVRIEALNALLLTYKDNIDCKLLSRDLDACWPPLDPQAVIGEGRILQTAKKLKLPPKEVRCRYEALAQRFGLRLGWQAGSEALVPSSS